MKKTFIKLMFCSFLAFASATTFVGCKDYDDDINNQQTQINQLTSQLTALETALNKAQSDATAANAAAVAAQKTADEAVAAAAKAQSSADGAQSSADAAQLTADEAVAAAAAAQQAADNAYAAAAAAQAKADALESVTEDLRKLIDENKEAINANSISIAENASKIAEILGRIDAIDSSLRQVQLDIEGNTARISALETSVDGVKKDLSGLQSNFSDLKTLVETIEGNVKTNADAIQALSTQLEAAKVQIAALEEYQKSSDARIKTLEDYKTVVEGKVKDLQDGQKKLEEATADLQQMRDNIAAIQKEISDLQTIRDNISALQTAVKKNTENIDKLNESVETINGQITDIYSKITSANNDITTLKGNVSDLEKTDSELKSSIASNAAQLTEHAKSISALETQLNTLAGALNGRLTSVTLMPDLYIGGIPSIAFKTLVYTELAQDEKTFEWATAEKATETSKSGYAIAEYRLNPANVTLKDIKSNELSFVYRQATSRAEEATADLLNISESSVDGGKLRIKITKNFPEQSLVLEGNKINTISLKVPIADEHLYSSEETGAAVYSEFTRLDESTVTPALVLATAYQKDGNEKHLYTYAETKENKGAITSLSVLKTEGLDLKTVVEACEHDATKDPATCSDSHISASDLAAYGLSIKFTVPQYKVDGKVPDEQSYLTIDENGIAKANVPNGKTKDNIIGTYPLVLAQILDGSAVVAAKYFRIHLVTDDLEYVPAAFNAEVDNICNFVFDDATITYKDFKANVLDKLNKGEGLTLTRFFEIYSLKEGTTDIAYDKTTEPTKDLKDEDIATLVWSATYTNDVKIGENTQTLTKEIRFVDNNKVYGDVVIKLTLNIKITLSKAELGAEDPVKYLNKTMKVYPVPMTDANYASGATYTTNILEGRTIPYVAKYFNTCDYARVVIAEAADQTRVKSTLAGTDYGKLKYPTDTQGVINEQGWFKYFNQDPEQPNKLLTEIIYSIDNTEDAQLLIKNADTITLNWEEQIGSGSAQFIRTVFDKTYLEFVPILTMSVTGSKTISDNSQAQTVNIANLYSLKDAYNQTVANTVSKTSGLNTAEKYNKFYGVSAPTYQSEKIYISDDKEGNENQRSLTSLNMTANVTSSGDLTFQNNGSPIRSNAYIIVPFYVTHYWGDKESTRLEGKIAVQLKTFLGKPRK